MSSVGGSDTAQPVRLQVLGRRQQPWGMTEFLADDAGIEFSGAIGKLLKQQDRDPPADTPGTSTFAHGAPTPNPAIAEWRYADRVFQTNRETIVAGSSTASQSYGLSLDSNVYFINFGSIEATAGVEGHGATGLHAPVLDMINAGLIRALSTAQGASYYLSRAVGLSAGPHGARIINQGTIESISQDGEAFGVWIGGLGVQLENSGTIYVSGDRTDDPLGIIGIRSGQSHHVRIENSGTIQVISTDPSRTAVGIFLFPDSTNVHAFGTVVNSGRIIADTAITAIGGYSTGIHVTNSGRIDGKLILDHNTNIITNLAGGMWVGDWLLGIHQDFVLNAGQVLGEISLGAGHDVFDGRGGTVSGTVSGGTGYDLLLGGHAADRLDGGDDMDRINGGGGADTLAGGLGSDVFVYSLATDSVAGAGDTITDFQTGIDKIDLSEIAPASVSFTFSGGFTTITASSAGGIVVVRVAGAASQSDVILTAGDPTGTGADDVLQARVPGATLTGAAGNDFMIGADGDELLDGGTGADVMVGGAGNDRYIVDNDGDRIIELGSGGHDEVASYVDYSLQAFVENITLLGSASVGAGGNPSDNVLIGNSGDNWLRGFGGDDLLYGGLGADALEGGIGADVFLYKAVEESTATRFDHLQYFQTGIDKIDIRAFTPTSFSFVEFSNPWASLHYTTVTIQTEQGTFVLRADGKLSVDDFLMTRMGVMGTEAEDHLVGGGTGDFIRGFGGADVLVGRGGGDRLLGGLGSDTFVFEAVSDSSLLDRPAGALDKAPCYDIIEDFTSGVDRIDLTAIDAIYGDTAKDAFSYLASAAFTGTAGELRCEVVGNRVHLLGDTDGDGMADFLIEVNGSTLLATDLIL